MGTKNDRHQHAGRFTWWRGGDSNPRPLGYEPNELPLLHPASRYSIIPANPMNWSQSGGLAAASPPVGQPHSTLRRCGGSRPGSGWDRVGPPRSGPRAPRIGSGNRRWVGRWGRGSPGREQGKSWRGGAGPTLGTVLGHEHDSAPVCCQPSTCHLATRSSSGGLTRFTDGDTRLAEGFPLRCFQRFARPNVATQRCRLPDNWSTSGSSSPVLSY